MTAVFEATVKLNFLMSSWAQRAHKQAFDPRKDFWLKQATAPHRIGIWTFCD